MSRPRLRNDLQSIKPYTQGKSRIDGHDIVIKLSSNESSFGPSQHALAAMQDIASVVHRYPDGAQSALREALAEVHQLDSGRIVCGNGSEELIGLVVRSLMQPGDEMLLSENHFMMCPIYGRSLGASVIFAPEKDYHVDVEAMLERVTGKTRMVIISNPNNPTGTIVLGEEIRYLHEKLPENVLLLLDDAYAEYVMDDNYESGLQMVEKHENVVVTRTFSKIYGLAGLRIGWGYFPDAVRDAVQKIRTPFNTNSVAMAMATEAVRDTAHVEMVREHNARWQAIIAEKVAALGIRIPPSQANFYLLDFSEVAGKSGADAARFLESRGIIPRPSGSNSSSSFLRLTVGLDEENEAALQAITAYMAD